MTQGSRGELHALDRLLVSCLRELHPDQLCGEVEALSPWALRQLCPAAEHHGVTLYLARVLSATPGVSPAALRPLIDAGARHAVGAMRTEVELGELLPALATLPRPSVVIKGPVLADHVYAVPDSRSYVDLDVVVHPRDLERALDLLHDVGATDVTRNWAKVQAEGWAEVTLALRRGTALDLHWGLIARPTLFPDLHLPVGEVLERRRHVLLRGVRVPTLDTADQLLHLCCHAVYSGGSILRYVLDVREAVLNDPPEWDLFLSRARTAGVGLVCAVMLHRSAATLRYALPDGLLDGLAGRSGWRALMVLHDRINPPTRSYGRALRGGSVVVSTRSTTWGSVGRIVSHTWADAVVAPLTDDQHPWRQALLHAPRRPAEPNPLEADVDGGARAGLLKSLAKA